MSRCLALGRKHLVPRAMLAGGHCVLYARKCVMPCHVYSHGDSLIYLRGT